MRYQRKHYGDDVMIEMRDANEDSFRAVMESLSAEERAKVIGYRKVVSIDAPEDGED